MAGDVKAKEDGISIHEFSSKLTDTQVHFQVLRMKDSFHVWLGTDSSLGATALAMNTPYERIPSATAIQGDHSDPSVLALAQRLAKRSGKQVLVSCSVDNNNLLLPLIEKRLHEEMVSHPDCF